MKIKFFKYGFFNIHISAICVYFLVIRKLSTNFTFIERLKEV